MAGGHLLWIVAAQLVLTGLPAAASALLAARLGLRSVPLLLAISLAGSGASAMLLYWAHFADPTLGKSLSFFLVFGSILATAWLLWERRIASEILRDLALPAALWALGTYFLVFLGFIHGGFVDPLGTAATRFSLPLPSDNWIPLYFGEWFYANGHSGTIPAFPDGWLSSDRPPLQVGYLLGQIPFQWDSPAIHYEAMGVALQQLWIVGLWALLGAAGIGRVTKGLAMITVLVSDLAIVNGFFVWPKMLPAALLLAAAALILTPLWDRVRDSFLGAALLAALLGLAIMGHGGSVFGVIPLLAAAAFRGLPSLRWIGAAVLVGLLFVAPWSAYQKWVDPPGTRLTKYMLAGVPEIDDRGMREAVFDSYGEVGVGGAIHLKGQNYVTMLGGGPMAEALDRAADAVGDGSWRTALDEVRAVLFYCLLPSLGLLLIVPILMALARARGRLRPKEWRFSLLLWATFAVGAVAWGLILFGNLAARAVLHAGSFLIPVLGFVAAVVGLRAVFPRFAVWYSMLAAALTLAIYVPALRPRPETGYVPLMIVLGAVALAGFCVLAFRGRDPGEASEV